MSQIEIPDWVVQLAVDEMTRVPPESDNKWFSRDIEEVMRECLRAALEGWLVPVAWGVQYNWEGTGKSEIRDLRFDKDSAEGAAFAKQSGIPPGFPIKVTARPLYTLRKEPAA